MHRSTFALLSGLVLACAPAPTAETPVDELHGAWRVVERTTITDGQAATNSSPQPGIYLFTTPSHYSIMFVPGAEPRAALSEAPSDSELVAAYNSITANSGRYERMADTLAIHPIVAKSPAFMAGGQSQTFTVRVAGDTLWLTAVGGFGLGTPGGVTRLERIR
jgi:hypothetical protein